VNDDDEGVEGRPEWADALPRDVAPPDEIRGRVVAVLRERGLLAPSGRRLRPLLASAAAVVLFAAGWMAGSAAERSAPAADRGEFMLLLFGGASAPGDEPARVREYGDWARRLAREGRHVSGERLGEAAAAVGGPLPSGPVPSGFFIVEAQSAAEARDLASGHPHVRHGGTIVIRRIAR
jgi:hypothetical protein